MILVYITRIAHIMVFLIYVSSSGFDLIDPSLGPLTLSNPLG